MLLQVFITRGLGAMATFGLTIYLARMLGAEEYGKYVFVIGVGTFIATAGQFGSGLALVKLRLAKNEERSVEQIFGYYAWHVFSSLAGISIGTGLFLVFSGSGQTFSPFAVIGAALAAFGILFSKNIFQSIKRSEISMMPDMIFMPALVATMIFLAGITSADAAIWVYISSAIATSAFFVSLFSSRMKGFKLPSRMEIHWRNWFGYSFGLFWSQIGHAILFIQLPIAYGFVSSPEELGIFSVAYKMAAVQLIAFTAIGAYALPQFADYRVMDDATLAKKLLVQIILISILAATPIAIILMGFPELVVDTLYGKSYHESATIIPILMIGIFFHTATGPLGNFLMMGGEERFYALVSVVAGAVGFLATVHFGNEYGMSAAAWSVTTTVVVWKLAVIYKSVRLYGDIRTKNLPQ